MKSKIEIRVLGQKRSGNHAIVNWIMKIFPNSKICFLNHLEHGDKDPYEVVSQHKSSGFNEGVTLQELKVANKDLLIYSYEDRPSTEVGEIDFLKSAYNPDFEINKRSYIGSSDRFIDVIMVRDAFNLLASRILKERARETQQPGIMVEIKDNWKRVAKKILETKQNENFIVIKYNNWVKDDDYKKSICKKLGGVFSNSSINDIASEGGGSSFNTTYSRLTSRDLVKKWKSFFKPACWKRFSLNFKRIFIKPNIVEDDFLTRWQVMKDDHEFIELLQDEELVMLSEKLFGEIPRTKEWLKMNLHKA